MDYWHNIGPQYAQYRWNVKKEVAGSVWLSAGCHAVDAMRAFMRDEIVRGDGLRQPAEPRIRI